jgi:hypothetical protein
LADDTILEMTCTANPVLRWSTRVQFIAAQAIGRSRDWRMAPFHANGQLAAPA